MSSFNQWRKSLEKNPTPRAITWVCGEEKVLIDDVLAYIKAKLQPEPWNYVHLVVGEDSERQIWNTLNQFPMGQSPRLVVIRHAQGIKDWEPWLVWVKNRAANPRTFVVLISDEDLLPKTEVSFQEKRRGVKPELLPHIAAIGVRGHTIECRPYTTATSKYSIEWVQSKVRMRDNVAKHMLLRANFNLRLVRDVCVKLAVLAKDQEITISIVNTMLTERPRDTFPDALLALDRKTALLAAEEIQPDDYGRIIGLLDQRVDLAGMVHDMMSEHHAPYEIARAAGAQAWLVPDIMNVSKHYNVSRRDQIRHLLAAADEAYRGGQRTGILQYLVVGW